jgi:hypothetical protein
VGKYLARYVAVRQRRLSLAAKLQSEDRFMDVEDDSISEVSTSFSEMSAYTTRCVICHFYLRILSDPILSSIFSSFFHYLVPSPPALGSTETSINVE